MKKGWHIHANPASMDTLVPTTLDAEVAGRKSTFVPRYPAGTPVSLGTGKGTVPVSVLAQGYDAEGRCLSPSTLKFYLPIVYN